MNEDNQGSAITGPIRRTGADIVPLPAFEQVRQFLRASKAEGTLRGYQADWRDFCAWCESAKLRSMPATPETVAAYVAECAGRLKVGSIQRRLNAMAEAHKAINVESPTHSALVRNTVKGIRRTIGTAPEQKAPTTNKEPPRKELANEAKSCFS